MAEVISYRDLDAWKLAMNLVEDVYRTTTTFPNSELYGLTSQVRRAAVSIPANLAEGKCRPTTRAYAHHVGIALGSQGELETCIEIAGRLGMVAPAQRDQLLETAGRVGQMLHRLHQSLERKAAREREMEAQEKARRQ